jgi:coenzyme F420-0:L-glutamate ligase
MKSKISVSAVPTELFHAGENLFAFLKKTLEGGGTPATATAGPITLEGKILAITSKIVSLAENNLVSKSISKKKLVQKEADHYLCEGGYNTELTIKHGFLFASAGIDESNSETDEYILLPKNPYQSAEKIHRYLKETFHLKNFGVILTDSHSMPFRRGVTGIALSHWGFRATNSLIGHKDLFGNELKFTHVDVADSLASMAVFVMGEANDCTPMALIDGAKVEFTTSTSASEIQIAPTDDLYFPLFQPFLDKQKN